MTDWPKVEEHQRRYIIGEMRRMAAEWLRRAHEAASADDPAEEAACEARSRGFEEAARILDETP